MARMPAGEPRSVPDPDGEGYDEMLRQQGANRKADGDPPKGNTKAAPPLVDWDSHPGFAESLVPFWGSTREAIADAREGDYLGAGLNGAMAVSDVMPGAFVVKGLGKAGIRAALKKGTSTTWKNTQRRMARAGYFEAGQQGHHWAIPQKWTWVPEKIRNHPANIKPLAEDIHKRVHSADHLNNLPRFSFVQRVQNGTPTWFKADTALAAGKGVVGGFNETRNSRKPPK
jgi:hypothetical protein